MSFLFVVVAKGVCLRFLATKVLALCAASLVGVDLVCLSTFLIYIEACTKLLGHLA